MFTSVRRPVFFNEKIIKKIFKNEKLGKSLSARVISEVMNLDFDDVYNNIEKSSEEIAFSALTINRAADSIYYNDKVYFNIEFNLYNNDSKPKQLESYVYQLYLGQLHTYQDYNKIKPIIQISIDSFDYLKHDEFIYKIFLMDYKHHEIVSNSIQFIHINLDLLSKMDYNQVIKENNKLMEYLYFLVCGNTKLDDLYERVDKLMKEIIDESKRIAGIEKMHLYLTDEEMMELDKKHYIEIGEEKGREETMHEMIMKMYNDNMALELISKYSDLSIDEIQKIIKEQKRGEM